LSSLPNWYSSYYGENDLWIAAIAMEHGAELITTDKDFSHLDGHFLKAHYIDSDKVLKG
jgi:hypothetical protein